MLRVITIEKFKQRLYVIRHQSEKIGFCVTAVDGRNTPSTAVDGVNKNVTLKSSNARCLRPSRVRTRSIAVDRRQRRVTAVDGRNAPLTAVRTLLNMSCD